MYKGEEEGKGEGDNKRKSYIEPLFRFHTKRAEKFAFVPLTMAKVQTQVHPTCVRVCTCACARMVGWLTSIKLVAIDREKDRAESSPVRGDGIFFIRKGRRTVSVRIAKLQFAPSTIEGEGQGLEYLTAGS